MEKIKIGIIGGAGYTGGELIRILINHPLADIVFVNSSSNAGKPIYAVHADLVGETELEFNSGDIDYGGIDVLFLCVGHGEAKKFLDQNRIGDQVRIIDLSQDFRLEQNGLLATISGQPVVYGLPELNKDKIRSARHV
ncbi:MAG TPA: hypothetical protein VK543_17810, partial [Puia sp.]|nr:hypothetical protein [Puia sp.]